LGGDYQRLLEYIRQRYRFIEYQLLRRSKTIFGEEHDPVRERVQRALVHERDVAWTGRNFGIARRVSLAKEQWKATPRERETYLHQSMRRTLNLQR
jgi:hypothetical protein